MKQELPKKKVPFTQVSNALLSDKSLSWKAKGVFAYLYSKPDDWDFSIHRMQNDSICGRDSLQSALIELENAGYLQRNREASGKMSYFLSYEPSTENPYKGKSLQGKTRTISNIEEYTNIEDIQKDSEFLQNSSSPSLQEELKFNKTPRAFLNARRAEKGKPPMTPRRTDKQTKTLEALKLIDYYKKKGYEDHGMQFFAVHDEARNKKVRQLFIRAYEIVGDKAKEMIDWWLSGEGEWANYEPENCFTTRNMERFLNKGTKKGNKITNITQLYD